MYLPVNLLSQALSWLQNTQIIQQGINHALVFLVWIFNFFLIHISGKWRKHCSAGKIMEENVFISLRVFPKNIEKCFDICLEIFLQLGFLDLYITFHITNYKKKNFKINNSKNWKQTPGWLSGWVSAFGSGHDPGVLGSSPNQAPCMEPASHSVSLPFSLCLSWIKR